MYTEHLDLLDLEAYLERIAYRGDLHPSAELLGALHQAHACHIPFENLDIVLGRPILLELNRVQDKLIHKKRGGYCFEQNTLLAAVLERLGFQVTPLAARVRLGATTLLPRTHMVLKVQKGAEAWLADVGFGGDGLLTPLPWTLDSEIRSGGRVYRLHKDDGAIVLQSRRQGAWTDLYAFSEEPQLPVDFQVANHYTSTHSSSRFVVSLTAQRLTPDTRFILRNREFTVLQGEEATGRILRSPEELLHVLADTFGLIFPAETHFRCPGLVW